MIEVTKQLGGTAVRRGGLAAFGKTKKEALAELEGLVDRALDGHYTPAVVQFRHLRAVVWRTPNGWSYALLNGDPPAGFGLPLSCEIACGDGPDARWTTMRKAILHLGQNAYVAAERPDPTLFADETGIGGTDEGLSLRLWVQWQNRYADGIGQGMEPDAARAYADDWTASAARRTPPGTVSP